MIFSKNRIEYRPHFTGEDYRLAQRFYQNEAAKLLTQDQQYLAKDFKYYGQVNALKILGSEKAELAKQILGSYQLDVLDVFVKEKVEVTKDIIDSIAGVNAYLYAVFLEILGARKWEVALKIVTDTVGKVKDSSYYSSEIASIKVALGMLKDSDNVLLASDFISYAQASALKQLGEKSAKKALQFASNYQTEALVILGQDRAKLALDFTNQNSIDALKILGANKAALALKFQADGQLEALKSIGAERAEFALEFNFKNELKVLSILGSGREELAKKFGAMLDKLNPHRDPEPFVNRIYFEDFWKFSEEENIARYKIENAIKALSILKDSSNIDKFINFTRDEEVKLLKILGNERTNLALDVGWEIGVFYRSVYDKNNIFKAAEMFEKYNHVTNQDASLACKITSLLPTFFLRKLPESMQVVLRKYCGDVKLSPLFDTDYELRTLEVLGVEKAPLALSISYDISKQIYADISTKFYGIKQKENQVFTVLGILKDTNNAKFTPQFANFQPSTYFEQRKQLEKCSNNLVCKIKYIDHEWAELNALQHCYNGFNPGELIEKSHTHSEL